MKDSSPNKNSDLTLADLYPDFTEEQLREAEENLERYLAITLRIYERISSDPEAYAQSAIPQPK